LVLPSGTIAVGVDAVSQGAADPVATVVFYQPDGSLENEVVIPNSVFSSIADMVYDPATGNIYVTGYTGAKSNMDGHAAMLLGISTTSERVVLNTAFQLGGRKTEARVVGVQGGKIFLAVKSDYEQCGLVGGLCSGDWVVIIDALGNRSKFYVGNQMNFGVSEKTSITGMTVLQDSVWVVGNMINSEGNITGYYFGGWKFDGSVVHYPAGGSPGYDSKMISAPGANGSANLVLGQSNWWEDPDNKRYIGAVINDQDYNFVTPGPHPDWDGDNSGAVSINLLRDIVLNPFESGTTTYSGVTAAGSLSKVGGTDPKGLTDGGIISWGPDGSVFWTKRLVDLPNAWTVSSVRAVKYDGDGRVVFGGAGSDGSNCAAGSPCPLAVVGKSCYANPAW
jgi:hypothetical protein